MQEPVQDVQLLNLIPTLDPLASFSITLCLKHVTCILIDFLCVENLASSIGLIDYVILLS